MHADNTKTAQHHNQPFHNSGYERWWLIAPLLLALLYAGGHMLHYTQSPLGRVPILDPLENITMAASFLDGTLPKEPFYRAPLYPLILTPGVLLFPQEISQPSMPGILIYARLLNLLFLLLTALLAGLSARMLWNSRLAGSLAALLTGLNPVILYFASDATDTLFATLTFTLTVYFTLKFIHQQKGCYLLYAGLALGLGILSRPQLLPLTAALVLIPWVSSLRTQKPRKPFLSLTRDSFLALLGPSLALLLFGLLNLYHGAQWSILPTQGAFDLWSANRPGAHGKFFIQTIPVRMENQKLNPARIESELLYARETGRTPPFEASEIQAHWRESLIQYIVSHPIQFSQRLARKSLVLIHNTEQYNNKTYSVHKQFSPWLSINPIQWAIIFLPACICLAFTWQRHATQALFLLLTAYAAGLLLSYVSARFRLPLLPTLALLASGLVTLPFRQVLNPSVKRFVLFSLLLVLTFLTLYPWPYITKPDTRSADYELLARSSLLDGQDQEAIIWAQQALQLAPTSAACSEILGLAHYNLWITGEETPTNAQLDDLFHILAPHQHWSPQTDYLIGLILWKQGNKTSAQKLWQHVVNQTHPGTNPAWVALLITQNLDLEHKNKLDSFLSNTSNTQLLLALALSGNLSALNLIQQRFPPEEITSMMSSLQALYFGNSAQHD